MKEMASGAIGMSVASCILNPLDVVKVRVQANQSSSLGMIDCARISMRNAGILRGIITPGLAATMIRDILNGAFRVGLYKEIERRLFEEDSKVPILVRKLVTGVVVGSTGAGLWSHTDLVKTRMQAQDPRNPRCSSTLGAYQSIVREGGMGALYQGVGPNMLRASIITTAHVGSYDASKKLLLHNVVTEEGPILWTLCGFMSALITTTAAAPVDLVRTQMMLADQPRSAFVTAKSTLTVYGIRGLFRGWLPSFYRFGPHFTLSWPLIEFSRKYLFNLESF
jgi:dicarboxylate transporter 10